MREEERVVTFEQRLVAAPDEPLDADDLDGLPEMVRRYFRQSLAAGEPVIRAARLRMRGHIKIGRWLPFRAREVLDPMRGFVWRVHVAGGLIRGFDRYLADESQMKMALLGVLPVVNQRGDDLAKSAAARCGAESLWVPGATLPRYGAAWEQDGASSAVVRFAVDRTPLEIRYEFDEGGRMRRGGFDRWGDPDRTGAWGWHRCGGEVTEHRRFGGVTIPSAGTFGWHYGTDRWPEGEFFRYQITGWEPATAPS